MLCSNFDFQQAIYGQEAEDVQRLEERIRRKLTDDEASHVGVTNLRKFLELELLERYKAHIPTITGFVNRSIQSLVCARWQSQL